MFKARPSRTFLTVLGMGVGISAILFLVALGYGIQNTLMEAITTNDSLLSLDVFPQKSEDGINQDSIEKIKSISNVEKVSPVYQTKAQIKSSDFTSDSMAMIVDDDYFSLSGLKIEKGASFKDPDDIIISANLSKIFDKSPEELLGKTLNFSLASSSQNNSKGTSFKFQEISQTFKISGFVESKDMAIYINSKDLAGLFQINNFSSLKVKCRSSASIDSVKNEIGSIGYSVSALNDVVKQADKVFSIVRIILGFFGMVALIVSAIGMFNTMTVTLLERTEEIGIMKSIGAYNSNILSMFVLESTIMGFLGGISGVIIGIAEGYIFNLVVNIVAKRMGGLPISLFYYPPWFIILILFSAIIVGFLTGVIPAKRASSIDPLDALRYK